MIRDQGSEIRNQGSEIKNQGSGGSAVGCSIPRACLNINDNSLVFGIQ